jgi:hypothetical protein
MSDTIKNTARNTVPTIKPVTVVDEGTKPVTIVDEGSKPVTVIKEEKPVTFVDEGTKPKTVVEEVIPSDGEKFVPPVFEEEETKPKADDEKVVTPGFEEFVTPSDGEKVVTPVVEKVVEEGTRPKTVVEEVIPSDGEKVVPPVIEESKGTSEQITLTIDKSTLVSLCQNLNTNLLVNIAAYKSVLAKLKDSEKDETKVGELDSNITNLNEIESSVSNLLNTVQTSLDVPKDKQIDPQTVIQEASSSGSGDFMQKVMGAEAAAVLGSMAAATVLALGGAKRKITKRRRNKGRKSTKRHKK